MLCLRDHHSGQFHHVEFRLFFIYGMFSWIVILNISSVPSLCFPSLSTPIIQMLALLWLSSILTTFSLTLWHLCHCPALLQWCWLHFHSNLFSLWHFVIHCVFLNKKHKSPPFYSVSFLSPVNFHFTSLGSWPNSNLSFWMYASRCFSYSNVTWRYLIQYNL